MDIDEELLRAIAEHPLDDSHRLKYADWLDGRSDVRGKFLRVQFAICRRPADKSRFRDLCEREQELVQKLEPSWVQRVRRYTTPDPCRDMTLLVPDLVPYARTTTRLHPHRAIEPLAAWVSKIGGRFLWPSDEPWPLCEKCNVAMTPVLQLRSSDVPNIAFPPGTDLMQIFWCPDEEAHDYWLSPRVWWRARTDVVHPRDDDPDLSNFPREYHWQGLIPFECCLFPERVIEYPIGDDLYALAGKDEYARIGQQIEDMDLGSTKDLAERFKSEYGPDDAENLAFCELGQCPSTKVGGRPSYEENGRRFDHLATLSTWEFDSASFRRWFAAEDQRLFAPPGKSLTWKRLFGESEFRPLQEVLGMQLGRTQSAHLFVCRDREPWEFTANIND